jgi:tripartite-type tricarboxylate transporter receptor subunit TctC
VLQRNSSSLHRGEQAGRSGNIGADAVAKARPTATRCCSASTPPSPVNPHIYKGMPFKPSDFKPVMVMASSGLLVGVNPGTGFKTMNDLIAAGKTKGVSFSSGGTGSPGNLAAAVFTEAAGLKINHIPYKGNTPAVTAVLSGEVDGGILATPGMLPHVKAGKITALAVTSRQRSGPAPDVPTVAEAGVRNLEQEVLYIAMVPAATPDSVVQVLQRAFADAMARPTCGAADGARTCTTRPHWAAAAAAGTSCPTAMGKVIRATGMKVE